MPLLLFLLSFLAPFAASAPGGEGGDVRPAPTCEAVHVECVPMDGFLYCKVECANGTSWTVINPLPK